MKAQHIYSSSLQLHFEYIPAEKTHSLKGIHPQITMMTEFIHPYVIPSLFDFLSSVEVSQNISFCVPQIRESLTGLEQHGLRASK